MPRAQFFRPADGGGDAGAAACACMEQGAPPLAQAVQSFVTQERVSAEYAAARADFGSNMKRALNLSMVASLGTARSACSCVLKRMLRVEPSHTNAPHCRSHCRDRTAPPHCRSHCHSRTACLTRHILALPQPASSSWQRALSKPHSLPGQPRVTPIAAQGAL